VKPRLLADENTSHRLVAACQQIKSGFPIMHISEWENGAYLSVKDPALLMTLREHEMILVGFERASMPLHAGTPRLGDRVIELHGVGHRYGDGRELFHDVELLLDNRERLGIVGASTGRASLRLWGSPSSGRG
jgi:hypothetical protein